MNFCVLIHNLLASDTSAQQTTELNKLPFFHFFARKQLNNSIIIQIGFICSFQNQKRKENKSKQNSLIYALIIALSLFITRPRHTLPSMHYVNFVGVNRKKKGFERNTIMLDMSKESFLILLYVFLRSVSLVETKNEKNHRHTLTAISICFLSSSFYSIQFVLIYKCKTMLNNRFTTGFSCFNLHIFGECILHSILSCI